MIGCPSMCRVSCSIPASSLRSFFHPFPWKAKGSSDAPTAVEIGTSHSHADEQKEVLIRQLFPPCSVLAVVVIIRVQLGLPTCSLTSTITSESTHSVCALLVQLLPLSSISACDPDYLVQTPFPAGGRGNPQPCQGLLVWEKSDVGT